MSQVTDPIILNSTGQDIALALAGLATAIANKPDPATQTPVMDGAGDVGISTKYAREDHQHPSDTSKATVTAYPSATISITDTSKLSAISIGGSDCVGNTVSIAIGMTLAAAIPTNRVVVAQVHGLPRPLYGVATILQNGNYLFAVQLDLAGNLSLQSIGQAQGASGWSQAVNFAYYTDGTILA